MSVYPRGFVRPLVEQPLLHMRRLLRDRYYREYQGINLAVLGKRRFQPGELTVGGYELGYVDKASLVSGWSEIFVARSYDLGTLQHAPFIIDAGANIGLAQLYWRRRYGTFDSIAFEPDPVIAAMLRRNLSRWGCTTAVLETALGAREGLVQFSADGADGGRLASIGGGGLPQVKVHCDQLSKYLDREVDLLKLDIEGAEHEVLLEARDRLSAVRRIFVECHSFVGRAQDYMDVLLILRDAGFRCFVDPTMRQEVALSGRISTWEGMDQGINVWGVRP